MSAAIRLAPAARAIPSASIASSGRSRTPAVSTSVTGIPCDVDHFRQQIARRPGTSVTIARPAPASRLNSDDFPVLGRPAITTCSAVANEPPSSRVAEQQSSMASAMVVELRGRRRCVDEVVALRGKVQRRLQPRRQIEQHRYRSTWMRSVSVPSS